MRQLVIFSADSARPRISDLAGLLVGPGEVNRMGGTARVSVPVNAAWRVHALSAEFAARRLAMSWESTSEGQFIVRTSYTAGLVSLTAPSFLDGSRLRLWFIAAGHLEDNEVVLGLGNNHALARPALAPLGLDGEVVKGPSIRIPGVRKRTRLADLIGERPTVVPPLAWPYANRRPVNPNP